MSRIRLERESCVKWKVRKWGQGLKLLSFPLLLTALINPTHLVLVVARAQDPPKRNLESSTSVLQQGRQISLNGKQIPVAWSQWQQGNSVRTGISDTAAKRLGLKLLSTDNPKKQPIQWFSSSSSPPLVLPARRIGAYRYLDISKLLQRTDSQLQIVGDTLKINSPPVKIENIRLGNHPWGKRIVVDLNRPTFWQLQPGKSKAAITFEGIAKPALIKRFSTTREQGSRGAEGQRGRGEANAQGIIPPPHLHTSAPPLLAIQSSGERTDLRLNIPDGLGLQVETLAHPYRLVIDLRAEAFSKRKIHWAQGLYWHRKIVTLEQSSFPVVWLEVDPSSPYLSLKPIRGNSHAMKGISPLLQMARRKQASAAINGGFFNRDNKLPLGAIRHQDRWLSGPILNRGAIAWNNQGEIKIGRLSVEETLTTSAGQRLSIRLLNSGYVQAGIARYTPAWGDTYTPLSDREIIVTVQDERVTGQISGGEAGQVSFPIPSDGYLLALRSNQTAASFLEAGTSVRLESKTVPAEFGRYPNILGAGPLLLQNSQLVLDAKAEKFSEAFREETAPRSVIGTTQNRDLIIAAIGRSADGATPTLTETARLMRQLGAADALNLDGGNSASLYLGGQLLNPSRATFGRVHNGLGIFVEPSAATAGKVN